MEATISGDGSMETDNAVDQADERVGTLTLFVVY
jgi:hypothetical protein